MILRNNDKLVKLHPEILERELDGPLSPGIHHSPTQALLADLTLVDLLLYCTLSLEHKQLY